MPSSAPTPAIPTPSRITTPPRRCSSLRRPPAAPNRSPSVNLTVTLTGQTGQTVTVNYAVTGGSADTPADFTISGTSLTFNPGETSKTVPITVVDDSASESDETIQVTLSSPTNATLGTNTVHTYTITRQRHRDPGGAVPASPAATAGEGTTPANLVVTLSQATDGSDVTVRLQRHRRHGHRNSAITPCRPAATRSSP